MAGLELSDIQGDIVRAYGNAYRLTTYVFCRIDDAEGGKAWLRSLLPRVTTAEPWPGATKPGAPNKRAPEAAPSAPSNSRSPARATAGANANRAPTTNTVAITRLMSPSRDADRCSAPRSPAPPSHRPSY